MLALRPKQSLLTVCAAVLAGVTASNGCSGPPQEQRVQPTYDKTTGKLSQLTVDAAKDGKPNITSYMDGTKFLRIEIDANEDGKIDRWSITDDQVAARRILADDGKADAWAFRLLMGPSRASRCRPNATAK